METVINVKTKEEYNKLMEIFEKKGWRWYSWALPTQDRDTWDIYKNNTCITYEDKFTYESIDYFKEEWYNIISFEEFLKQEGIEQEYEEQEFKEGEKILVRHNNDEYEEPSEWEERIFLFKNREWKYVCVSMIDEEDYLKWNTHYIVEEFDEAKKIDEVKIRTEDWQVITISKEKARELGFKF